MDAFYSQAVQQKSLEARLVRRLHVRETGAVGQAVRRGWTGRSGGAVAAPQVIGADDAEAVRIQRLAGADDAGSTSPRGFPVSRGTRCPELPDCTRRRAGCRKERGTAGSRCPSPASGRRTARRPRAPSPARRRSAGKRSRQVQKSGLDGGKLHGCAGRVFVSKKRPHPAGGGLLEICAGPGFT